MQPHFLIVGAGITGAALAYHLGDKARVTVIDCHPPATAASGRSFGWINASFFLSPAHYDLRVAGMQAHRRLVAALNCPTQFDGCLWYEDPDLTRAATQLRDLGYAVQTLDRAAISARIPDLATPPKAALFFAEEGATDLAELTRRLLAASGATVILGSAVERLTLTSGRVTGVQTAGETITADQVILATGCGTPDLLATVGLHLPLLPRPGAMIVTRPLPPILPCILATPTQELRQDGAGRLLAPASAAHQSDSAAEITTPARELQSETLTRLRALFPRHDIQAEQVLMAQRPVPADGLPVIGRTGIDGLWISVMHSGATLGPVAGELLAAQIMGRDVPSLGPFTPARILTTQ